MGMWYLNSTVHYFWNSCLTKLTLLYQKTNTITNAIQTNAIHLMNENAYISTTNTLQQDDAYVLLTKKLN